MKKYLYILLALPFLAMECENKKFEYVATIDMVRTYEINENGPFNDGAIVEYSEILDMLDIPENADIGEVNIESISIRIILNEGNQANALNISGIVELGSSSANTLVFENFPVVLIGPDVPYIGINSLISEGVEKIKNKIENYLMGTDTAPFFILVTGDTSPTGGQLVKATILLKINGTVKYTVCEEMPWFIEGGEPC